LSYKENYRTDAALSTENLKEYFSINLLTGPQRYGSVIDMNRTQPNEITDDFWQNIALLRKYGNDAKADALVNEMFPAQKEESK
jgi:hypothetical protein